MGLFNFFKRSGRKTKSAGQASASAEEIAAARAAEMQQHIKSLALDVRDLAISIDDDQVTVRGEATSQEVREKVILALGNTDGVACVDDQMTVKVEEPEAVFYEVKSGDSLSKIALAHYGDAMRYKEIFEANRPLLKSPDLIYPGQVLRIPPDGSKT